MNLDDVRREIDETDDKILALFLRRMELGKQAMREKVYGGKPLVDRRREREILKKVTAASEDMSLYTRRLFKELMNLSRAYQSALTEGETALSQTIRTMAVSDAVFPKMATVACQGIEGANAQQAADRLFSQGNVSYYESFEAVADAVRKGLCDFGVLPCENSWVGTVRATYDSLQQGGLCIVRSLKLFIRHELLARPGTALSDIKEIISHEQALGQCRDFLAGLNGSVKITTCANTALAAKIASEAFGTAAVSSPACAELYGLSRVTNIPIQDSDNNYTRFICFSKKPVIYPGANRLSFMVSCKHEAGALFSLIAAVDALDAAILKLESRPLPGSDFDLLLFMDIEANVDDPGVIGMLNELQRSSKDFLFLGNYQEI